MLKRIKLIFHLMIVEIIILLILIKSSNSLRCRNDDGPSDGELKRVARSCMRKFSDNAFSHKTQLQQQQQQQSGSRYSQRVMNRENYGYNYEDTEDSNEEDFEDQYGNNNNFNNRNYYRPQGGNNYNNHERGNNYNGGGGGGGNSNDDRQRNRSRYQGNNYNNRTNNGNNNWNFSNQRNNNYMGSINFNNRANNGNNNNSNRNRGNSNNNNNNNQNNNSSDASCIVHCFFEEMHMLNNNNYPDRHKMLFILTKDIRDRELRNFYTGTIQECFRYLEIQKKRDACQFSKDLITCMTEYAKGNCDDWNEFNVMFN